MIFLFIAIGIIILLIILYRMGGKEIDKQLIAVGGLRKMYAPLVDGILSKPQTILLKNTPSRIVIVGQRNNLNYMWQICTQDGKKIRIRITVKSDTHVVEQKNFDFPISPEWQSVQILNTINQLIQNKGIL